MARMSRHASEVSMENACKTVLANIRFSSPDRPVKTVSVTSSQPGEGKSTLSFNLARAAASSGRETALVECDMRHRTLASLVGSHGAFGLYAAVTGERTLDEVAQGTSVSGLSFVDVEPGIPNPSDVIDSERFRAFVLELRSRFDLVVFDTPPVGGFVDAAVLSTITDGTLFVVRDNYTRRELAEEALDQLRKAGANVLGAVLNCCEREADERYYGYYESSAEASAAAPATPPARVGRHVR